jgi:glycerol-3-phosphate cytidylyltransferase-like family protein
VNRDQVPAGEYLYVGGTFDPLLAEHARRLAHLRRNHAGLVVVIIEGDHAILPARARAELVAGLASVDYVIIGGEPAVDETIAHQRITAQLVQHVARRHGQ